MNTETPVGGFATPSPAVGGRRQRHGTVWALGSLPSIQPSANKPVQQTACASAHAHVHSQAPPSSVPPTPSVGWVGNPRRAAGSGGVASPPGPGIQKKNVPLNNVW